MKDALIVIGFCAIGLAGVIYLFAATVDCSGRGGALVKNAWGGVSCIEAVK